MTGLSDTAALAAIGAAARELKLPTVRADASRLAGERQTHLQTTAVHQPHAHDAGRAHLGLRAVS